MKKKITVAVCMGSSCYARGNRDLVEQLKQYLVVEDLEERVLLKGALCSNMCGRGPIALVDDHQVLAKDGQLYTAIIKLIEEKLR